MRQLVDKLKSWDFHIGAVFLMDSQVRFFAQIDSRVVQTQAILFLKSMSERGGSDIVYVT